MGVFPGWSVSAAIPLVVLSRFLGRLSTQELMNGPTKEPSKPLALTIVQVFAGSSTATGG